MANIGADNVVIVDGTLDFSGGVNSIKVTTLQSESNPNGLARNELAWLDNAGTRDGGILQRTGWQLLGTIAPSTGLYQGGFMYELDGANPYLIVNISGITYAVLIGVNQPFSCFVINLTALWPGTGMPATQPKFYYCQAEKFLIIQAGDLVTKPLFWDSIFLRRSLGITNPVVAPGTPGVNEIPAAASMDYFMGRLWYAQGRQYSAGDMVGGPSGTLAYNFTDSLLNVTENPLVLGGDGFTVPTYAGNVRALFHNANLNQPLGQGQLLIGTRKAIYALQVPVTRQDWINATSNNQPVQTVAQFGSGPVNDRSVVKVNGDVFYQTLDPSIASLFASVRYFNQWGNRQISSNENRVLQFNNRSLLFFSSGIDFDNRLLQTALPRQLPQGVVHDAVIPLDFVPINNFNANVVPIWQGIYEGLQILQMFTGDFGGRQRAFAIAVSRIDSSIQLWELTDYQRSDFNQLKQVDAGEERVTWVVEFPAFTANKELELKKLVSAEIWVDKLYGTVDFTMEYRPDADPCWQFWHRWQQCAARTSCEDVDNPICYPLTTYRESYRATMVLPRPPERCESATGRPSNIAYQFQPKLTIKGWCRIRGIRLFFEPVDQKLYHNMVCGTQPGLGPIPKTVAPIGTQAT